MARRRVQVSPRRQGNLRNGSPQKWNGVPAHARREGFPHGLNRSGRIVQADRAGCHADFMRAKPVDNVDRQLELGALHVDGSTAARYGCNRGEGGRQARRGR